SRRRNFGSAIFSSACKALREGAFLRRPPQRSSDAPPCARPLLCGAWRCYFARLQTRTAEFRLTAGFYSRLKSYRPSVDEVGASPLLPINFPKGGSQKTGHPTSPPGPSSLPEIVSDQISRDRVWMKI